MTKGKLITIEGPEGSGKSSLSQGLVQTLADLNVSCQLSKEPGWAFQAKLRQIILQDNPSPLSELFLFLADRAEHVAKRVIPLLEKGVWVILDRFSDSTLIYQAIAKQVVDEDVCLQLCRLAEQGVVIDRTFLLQASFEVCQHRLAMRADQQLRVAQQGGTELEEKIWHAYKHLPKLVYGDSNPQRFREIDVTHITLEEVVAQAMVFLEDFRA